MALVYNVLTDGLIGFKSDFLVEYQLEKKHFREIDW